MTNEEKLLEHLKSRKRDSLEKAIDIYTPYVSVVIYNIIGGVMAKEDVEEVVSDVFIALWKNAESLDSTKGSIRTYLGAVARNCAKKKLRSVCIHDALDDMLPAEDIPEETALRREERRQLLELIRTLGEPDSEIFLRHYWYGERVSKIAAATGVCKSTVQTKLQRGRKKLKEILEVRQ